MLLLKMLQSPLAVSRGILPTSLLFLVLVGCGSNSASTAETGPGAQTATSPIEPSAVVSAEPSKNVAATSSKSTKHRRDEVWVDEHGQKWFGNVPLDAFFDSPYDVAGNQTPVDGSKSTAETPATNEGNSAVATTGGTTPTLTEPVMAEPAMAEKTTTTADTTSATAASGVSGDGDSWGSFISLATLEEEIKSIRNFMNENVQSVGTFNSSMLMIPPKAAALGALAGVAMEYPEAVSWKDDAKYVRDLAKQINSAPLQRGAKDQKRVQELYEAISDTLNRSKPAGLKEPPETDSFAEVSEMRLLMMRMEEAEKKMKTEAGTEGAMGSKKDMILHEASMLSMMAKIVSTPGYGYGDDAKFTGYAKDIMTASQEIKTSAEAGNFAAYEGALTKVATTCSNCHSDYKND